MINDHETIGPLKKNILLVQPEFPIPNKRRINHDFFPIGLLKIGTYLKKIQKCNVELTFENKEAGFVPDEIWITSLFTYWSSYVHDSISYYRKKYPQSTIYLGGIYATLMADKISIEGVKIQQGVYTPAENYCKTHNIDESLLDCQLNFQILHSMRGCFRKCSFCGTWRIEPKEEFINILSIINKNHVIFYDNNILRRPNIAEFLKELSNKKVNNKHVIYESQSGFDGRILDQNIANLLHAARFKNVRIAWDGGIFEKEDVKKQIEYLYNAGYQKKDVYVFMLFNWDISPAEMEKKRIQCWNFGVQISDCRYRPLDQLHDDYSTRLTQNGSNYFINSLWTDETIKRFRRNIRKHNICIRHELKYYSNTLERKKYSKEEIKRLMALTDKEEIKTLVTDAWFPEEDQMKDLI